MNKRTTKMTLGDLMHAAAKKSHHMSHSKSKSTMREVILQNQMVKTVNLALAENPLSTEVISLDHRFINQTSEQMVPLAEDHIFPSVPSSDFSEDLFEDLSEEDSDEYFEDLFEDLSEEDSDEYFEDLSEEDSESIPDLQSYEYFEEGAHTEFPIIGEDDTHAEFPDENTMATAFDNVHMLVPSDCIYMLPTQPGFDMSAPSQFTAEYDFGDVAVLNPDDEQALAEQLTYQLVEQLDCQLFEKYMLALIQANGILHAVNGTSPSIEEFFGLQNLINRVFTNTATEADRRYVAFLLSIVSETADEL
jgi:hypothetical protein